MKNRRKVMKFMKSHDVEKRFSINELADGTSLKKSQIDYEIKLMLNKDIVEKMADVTDLRKAYYKRGERFDTEFEES